MSDKPRIHEAEINHRTWRIIVPSDAENEAIARHVGDVALASPVPDLGLDGASLSGGLEGIAAIDALVDADIVRAATTKIASEGLTGGEVTLSGPELVEALKLNDARLRRPIEDG